MQAVQLKRQAIQAKAMQELDNKTNELLLRNAQNTAQQSTNIARMSGGSSIQIETLQKTYATIKEGIEETKQVQEELASKRSQDSLVLEQMKQEMKQKGLVREKICRFPCPKIFKIFTCVILCLSIRQREPQFFLLFFV